MRRNGEWFEGWNLTDCSISKTSRIDLLYLSIDHLWASVCSELIKTSPIFVHATEPIWMEQTITTSLPWRGEHCIASIWSEPAGVNSLRMSDYKWPSSSCSQHRSIVDLCDDVFMRCRGSVAKISPLLLVRGIYPIKTAGIPSIRIGLVARICRSHSSKDDQIRQGRGSIPRFGITLLLFLAVTS
jgi:hypothetical protein